MLLRELDGLAADGVVTPQRMADPVVGHQDAGQVWVAMKDDAEQVVGLSLVPVRRREEVLDGVDLRRIPVNKGAHTQLLAGLEVAQLVNDLEPRRPRTRPVGKMVDAR